MTSNDTPTSDTGNEGQDQGHGQLRVPARGEIRLHRAAAWSFGLAVPAVAAMGLDRIADSGTDPMEILATVLATVMTGLFSAYAAVVAHQLQDDRDLVAYAADLVATRRNPVTGEAEILMIRRRWAPFKGAWAFPGGHVNRDETSRTGAAREGLEETHLPVEVDNLVFVDVYDAPGRDPRGRVVGTAWHVHLTGEDALAEPEADDDAAAAEWVNITDLLAGRLGAIAFDHGTVIRDTIAKYPTPAA
ncbi:NUDIX domain-containing protein [Glycomyces artemisiae]|uniref:ADP-ribose pyrophosphatase YjhB (NUDIX family) n=1 Tax=Glycomyces artemisiae TaxID=1076443 RepID=A0A2T0U6H0_9ACTN|nr:NUDIX domain-containing protein [Glycomyces artemisiae]PRY53509.1 ADP-ribose pyrophosphatase YjhB (NUDIX family) [Glycomyces artemisiae]